MKFYNKVCDLEIHFGQNNILFKTGSDNIYYWTSEEIRQFQLPSIKKIVHQGNSMCSITQKGDSTHFITQKGDLYAQGSNYSGQLGLGSKVSRCENPERVDLSNVEDIACGLQNILALTSNGNIYSWGSGFQISYYEPQKVELSNVRKIYCEGSIKFAITESNELYTWGFNGSQIPQLLMSGVKELLHSSFIITLTNELYAIGENIYGNLGLGHRDQVLIPQKVMSDIRKVINRTYLTMAITVTNDVYYWGRDDPLPVRMKISNVKDIYRGSDHTIILTYDNEIYGLGSNEYGQLGHNEVRRYKDPLKIKLSNVREVVCSGHYSFALTYTNELYAWGRNNNIQLGLGKERTIYAPRKVQIENVKHVYCPTNFLTIIVTLSGEVYYSGTWRNVRSKIPKKIFPF